MEEIYINKRILSRTKDIELKEDVIVPDVKPDIVNILDCNALAYVYKIEKTNEKIRIDGNIDACIVYMSAEGETRSIQTTFNFSDILEDGQIKEETLLKYNLEISKIETKVLNERKITTMMNLNIKYDLYKNEKIQINNDFEKIEGLQKKENNITVNSLIGISTTKASLKEELKVDNMDNVAEILKVDIKIENPENKISYNKVLSKVGVNVSIMYLTEDDRISKIQETLPLMSFIDIENIKEENICDIDYKIRNILIKLNNTEEHSILCQIEFELICEAFEIQNLKVVSDIYSLKNEVRFDSKEIKVDVINKDEGYPIKIDERIEIENIKKVLEIDTNTKIIKNTNSGDSSNIEGEIEAIIYYENLSQSGLNVKKVNIPFISKTKRIDNIFIEVVNKEIDLDENNVILQMELAIKSRDNTTNTFTIIDNISIIENEYDGDYSMIVYFVKPGDSIWKIAKNLRVTMDSIIKVNNLENPDCIYPGDKLYILR